MTVDNSEIVTNGQEIHEHTDTKLSEFAKSKGTEGYTNEELANAGLSPNTRAAKQRTYRAVQVGIVRPVGAHRPQKYYHKDFVADVEASVYSNKFVTKGGIPMAKKARDKEIAFIESIADEVINHTLETDVLPFIRYGKVGIHRLHFHIILCVNDGSQDETYSTLKGYGRITQKGAKVYERVINGYRVTFHINPNNTVMVYTESSRRPLPLASQQDKDEILAWWGEIRQALNSILHSVHSNLVPPISEWIVTGSDLNIDIDGPASLHFSNNRVKIKHLSHLFQVYIKSLGDRNVTRAESEKNEMKQGPEWLEERFTFEGLQRRLTALEDQILAIADDRAKDKAEIEALRIEVAHLQARSEERTGNAFEGLT